MQLIQGVLKLFREEEKEKEKEVLCSLKCGIHTSAEILSEYWGAASTTSHSSNREKGTLPTRIISRRAVIEFITVNMNANELKAIVEMKKWSLNWLTDRNQKSDLLSPFNLGSFSRRVFNVVSSSVLKRLTSSWDFEARKNVAVGAANWKMNDGTNQWKSVLNVWDEMDIRF